MLLFVGLPLAAAAALRFLGAGQKAWAIGMLASAIGGLLAPDLVARRLRKRYLRELERGLPDALDLMVICSEAGLALEGAVERVAARDPARPTAPSPPKFSVCSSELRILADRRAALMNMAERTRLDLLRRLGMTLAQTLQYGTPLTQALRTLSAEMRQRPAGAVRGEGGEVAGAADRADDPLHPADAVPGGRRAGHAAGVAAMVRPLLHDARGATAVEFALVGSAFFAVLLLMMEACWQVAIGAALDAGGREAARWAATGQAPPAGFNATGHVADTILKTSGLPLDSAGLSVTADSFPGFGSLATPAAAKPGPRWAERRGPLHRGLSRPRPDPARPLAAAARRAADPIRDPGEK